MGSITSPALQFVLAGIPPKPTPAPSVDAAGTTVSAIKVLFENTNPDTGGSPVLLYELQMDDGLYGPLDDRISGEFTTIFTSAQ